MQDPNQDNNHGHPADPEGVVGGRNHEEEDQRMMNGDGDDDESQRAIAAANHRHQHHEQLEDEAAAAVPRYVNMILPDNGSSSSSAEQNNKLPQEEQQQQQHDAKTAASALQASTSTPAACTKNNNKSSATTQSSKPISASLAAHRHLAQTVAAAVAAAAKKAAEDHAAAAAQDQQEEETAADVVPPPSEVDVVLNANDQVDEYPGNVRYTNVVRHLSKRYTKVKSGYRKAAVQILVNAVKAQGGRFLRYDEAGKLKVVSDRKAYSKANQAMKEVSKSIKVVPSSSKKRKSKNKNNSNSNKPSTTSSGQEQQQQLPDHDATQKNIAAATASSAIDDGDLKPKAKKRKYTQEESENLEITALRLQAHDPDLIHVYLDLTSVDHDYIFPLAKALDSTKTLRSMEIRLSSINRTNADALSWGLKSCKSLKQVKIMMMLDHDSKVNGNMNIGSEEYNMILTSVLSNPNLESINIDRNGLDGEQVKHVCKLVLSIASKSVLQRFSVEGNPFGDDGAKSLCDLILKHPSLRFLNLGRNGMGLSGIEHIRKALSKRNRICLFEVSGLGTVKEHAQRELHKNSPQHGALSSAHKKKSAGDKGEQVLPDLDMLDPQVWKDSRLSLNHHHSNHRQHSNTNPSSSQGSGSDQCSTPQTKQ